MKILRPPGLDDDNNTLILKLGLRLSQILAVVSSSFLCNHTVTVIGEHQFKPSC